MITSLLQNLEVNSEDKSFLEFLTESYLLCVDNLQQMNIIYVFDRKGSDDSHEKSQMAKEMVDAIIKVAENYKMSEIEKSYSSEEVVNDEDVTMLEGVCRSRNNFMNNNTGLQKK